MKAAELRIGNLAHLYTNDSDFIVVKIEVADILRISSYEDAGKNSPYRGIPITEELLIKSDFIKHKKEGRYGYRYCIANLDANFIIERDWREKMTSHFFGIEYTDSPFPEDQGKIYNFAYEITYVHQLQNLVFSLLQKELEWH